MIRPICGPLAALMAIAVVTTAMAQPTKNAPLPTPAPNATPNSDQSNVDVAYGAFQRGFYLTAFNEATKRAQQNDPAAMTLLGELYAQGLGVGRDDLKAAQWYKMAAAKGDRDAIFALAMFSFQGRAGPRSVDEAARLLEAAAKLGHPSAAYDLGLLYLQGQQFPQDFKRAAELFVMRRKPATPRRSTRLQPCIKKAAAHRRTSARRCVSCSRLRSAATPTRWWNSRSLNSMETARLKTKRLPHAFS